MIKQFLIDLSEKFNKYTCYTHNLSSFDGLYLIKLIYQQFKSNVLLKDNKLFSIKISNKNNKNNKNNEHSPNQTTKQKNKIKLQFHDSLLLLTLSLNKLIKSFSIKTKKL
jgi:hypothetical protein